MECEKHNQALPCHSCEIEAEYEALGIHDTTWACISIDTKQNAMKYLWELALEGEPALVAQDADDPKKYHIAVRGGLRKSPASWVVSIRGADHIQKCRFPVAPGMRFAQHPQAGRKS